MDEETMKDEEEDADIYFNYGFRDSVHEHLARCIWAGHYGSEILCRREPYLVHYLKRMQKGTGPG